MYVHVHYVKIANIFFRHNARYNFRHSLLNYFYMKFEQITNEFYCQKGMINYFCCSNSTHFVQNYLHDFMIKIRLF